jgi:hypothetical protein
MDWNQGVVALVGHSNVLAYVIVGFFVLKRLPGLIAAFRVVVARDEGDAKQARKALEAIEPRWALDLAAARLKPLLGCMPGQTNVLPRHAVILTVSVSMHGAMLAGETRGLVFRSTKLAFEIRSSLFSSKC